MLRIKKYPRTAEPQPSPYFKFAILISPRYPLNRQECRDKKMGDKPVLSLFLMFRIAMVNDIVGRMKGM